MAVVFGFCWGVVDVVGGQRVGVLVKSLRTHEGTLLDDYGTF